MKISSTVIDKPNMSTLTSSSMQVFLYLCKNQDVKGKVNGVHYKDVVKGTGIVKQSFYNAIKELKNKELISYYRVDNGSYYNITILDNDFSHGKEDYKKGYIDLSRKVFHRKEFKKLKSHEIYLLLQLLKRTHKGRNAFRIRTKTFYDQYTKLFKVTKRVVRSYLHNIRKFFSIGIIKGIYYITYKHSVFAAKVEKPERFFRDKGFILYLTKKLKIKNYSNQEIQETTELVHQYRNMCKEAGKDIKDVILNAFYHINKDRLQKDRKLDFKYANMLINKHLRNNAELTEYKEEKSSELESSFAAKFNNKADLELYALYRTNQYGQ